MSNLFTMITNKCFILLFTCLKGRRMKKSEQIIELTTELANIAHTYSQLLYDYGVCVYAGPFVRQYCDHFTFSVGPTTHGMTQDVNLPLTMLDGWTDEQMQELAAEQKIKWERERERDTCRTCGHKAYRTHSRLF